ncbi:MAG: hypothetical protein LBL38_02340 [Lactobacillales bacterium]|nr:hypothetical protein [Lactobacillales bacterium]
MEEERIIALVGPAFENLSRKEMLEDQGEKDCTGKIISNVTLEVPAICAKITDNLINATILFCQPTKP